MAAKGNRQLHRVYAASDKICVLCLAFVSREDACRWRSSPIYRPGQHDDEFVFIVHQDCRVVWYDVEHPGLPRNERAWSIRRKQLQGSREFCMLQLNRVYVRDNGICYICGCSLTRAEATRDHVIPLALGGAKWDNNVKLCCSPCNTKKANKRVMITSDGVFFLDNLPSLDVEFSHV